MGERIDVNRIDCLVFQEVFKANVALLDFPLVTHLVELFLGALADGVHVGVGVTLINRNEFGPKT
jgi:hypothetical protein